MRRKVVTLKDRKNQVKNEENSKECLTSINDGDKNLLQNTAGNETLGESSGVTVTSKGVKKKDVIKNSENVALSGSVENSQKAVLASKHGGKNGNMHLESIKVVSKSVSNGELKEKDDELIIEKDKLKDVEIIAENPKASEERDVNEVLMKQGKKQMENKKANKNSAGDAFSDMKPVGKQMQEKESNEDFANEDDDFVNDKRNASGKHGKKGQITADTKNNNATESKNVPKKNLRKNATKGFTDNKITPASVSSKAVQASKGNKKRKNKNESELNNEPDVKRSKSGKESSDEAQDGVTLVKKELRVVLDRCEEFETINENADLPPDTLVSLKNGKSKAGTKRKRGNDDDEGKKGDKKTRSAKEPKQPGTSKSSSKKEKIPDVTSMNFGNDSKSSSGKTWNFKVSSWNINGIRAWLEKNGLSFLHHEKPDVMCFQETKCSDEKLPEEVKSVEGYHAYWLSGDKDGYSGVGLLSKEKPLDVKYGIDVTEHDNEGRVITAEYEKFYVVAVYVPNAGRGLVRLDYRMEWDKDFHAYLKKLDEKKPVILCGDLNVAHEEIDLANPKTNKKNAGFTKEEREGFSTLLSEGFIDTFRYLYPDMKGAYTFWTYMMNARAKNVGWRLDYFVISKRFDESLCDCVIRKDVLGSDHCPVTLFLSV